MTGKNPETGRKLNTGPTTDEERKIMRIATYGNYTGQDFPGYENRGRRVGPIIPPDQSGEAEQRFTDRHARLMEEQDNER